MNKIIGLTFGNTEPKNKPLEKKNVAELLEIAAGLEIEVPDKATKAEILALIMAQKPEGAPDEY